MNNIDNLEETKNEKGGYIDAYNTNNELRHSPISSRLQSRQYQDHKIRKSKPSKLHNIFFHGIPHTLPLRTKVKIKLTNSSAGFIWDAFQTIVSLIACVFYVLDTYENHDNATVSIDELIFTALFSIDLIIRFYACDNRFKFPFETESMVDIATVVPVYLELGGEKFLGGGLSFLRFIRILRVLRILRAFKILNRTLSAVDRQFYFLILTVSSIIFLSAGLVELVEDIAFLDALYFIVVTISTVGYGDFIPKRAAGKVIISSMLIFSLIIVPMQINKLRDILTSQSRFRRSYHPQATSHHVLVLGNVNDASVLRDFLSEFFHPDRLIGLNDITRRDTDVVIFSNEEPKEEVRPLLLNPIIESKVFFIQGSVLSENDLYRVAAHKAEAVFVLTKKSSKTILEDSNTLLRALMLENFNPQMEVLVQITSPKSMLLLEMANVDKVVCIEFLRMSILALSSIIPGFSTLISNLLKTSMTTTTHNKKSRKWKREYIHGGCLEIYTVPLPGKFNDFTFKKTAEEIYYEYNGKLILIGIENRRYNTSFQRGGEYAINDMLVNPINYKIKAMQNKKVYSFGYILAPDERTAHSLWNDFEWDTFEDEHVETKEINIIKNKSNRNREKEIELTEINNNNTDDRKKLDYIEYNSRTISSDSFELDINNNNNNNNNDNENNININKEELNNENTINNNINNNYEENDNIENKNDINNKNNDQLKNKKKI